MRPPSYYASIVKNNSSNSGAGHLYGSPDYDSARNPRTSSQQLRSSFSSPSSSSYVSRSHLPFAPHSTLVAHCFTGAGSSTRPYNSPSSSSSSPTSNHLLSRQNSRGSSYISSSSSLSSSYASNSAGSSVSSLNSRVPSTKRQPYSSSSSPSTAGLMRPSYLSPSVLTSSPTSRYRPVTASSYYKPIRLRERPLLTQLSRRLNSTSPTPRLTASDATSASSRSSGAVAAAAAAAAAADSLSRLKIDNAIEPETGAYEEQPANEASWSSDIGRNISRNKYLIKFREIDKSHPSTRPVVDVEATIELPTHEHEHRLTRIQSVPDREETPARDEAEMQLPKSQKPKEHQEPLDEGEAPCDKKIESSGGGQKVAAPSKKAPLKKEKKNVKLKVRAIGSKTSTNENEATTTTTIINKPAENKAEQPKEQVKAARAKDVAPALRKEEAKGALLPQPPAKADDEKKEEEAKAPAAKVKRVIKTSTEAKENKQLEPVAASETKASEPAPPTAAPTQREPARKEEALQPTQTKTKVVKIKKRPKTMDEQSPEGEQENATKTKTKLKLAAPKAGSKKMKEGPAADVSASKSEKGDQKMAPAGQKSTDKQTPARIRFREYNYNDFNFLTVLGHGGWGFVILAELKEHEACFAVKCIKKITIVEDDDYDSIMIERKVLTLGNIHPFICKLFCTFETPGYLFFVMEYCAGGDLMFHVQHEGKFAESRCRFYAAEIICAIRFLHNRHIIYRDLKLDNILLDERGHIRLVDFGMCQCRTYREELLPSNFCGTPEYISPEIIKGVPYNHSVDWWSFGVLLYEMAIGKMPFRGDDENELLWNVCYEQIHYPMFLSKELTSLLKLLLEREPTKRMGMATCKAGDIYEQPFFRGVDWKAVEELRVEPPFVPEVRSNRDVSNFDSDFTESTCELSPVDESTLAKIDQTQFQQFPYTNPDIFIFDSPRAAGPT